MRRLLSCVLLVVLGSPACVLLAGKDQCLRQADCWYGRVCGWDGRCHEPEDVPAQTGTSGGSGGTASSTSASSGGGSSSGGAGCEEHERVVVLTEDPSRPIQVLKPVGASLLPVEPVGGGARALQLQDGGVPPDADAITHAGDRLYVALGQHLTAVDSATLTQVPLHGSVLSSNVGSTYALVATPRYLVGGGAELWQLDLQDLAAGPTTLGTDPLHRVVLAPGPGNSTRIAANLEQGYAVYVAAQQGSAPALIQRQVPGGRFGGFGDGVGPRALALDAVTGILVLGNMDGLTVLRPDNGYALTAADEPTRQYPSVAVIRNGVAIVGGQGWGEWVKLDVTQSPLVTLDTQVAPSTQVAPRQAVLGCRRMYVTSATTSAGLVSYDFETMEPLGVALGGVRGVAAVVVDRAALHLAGDE